MTAPKLDKARREWLAGLKEGDEVVSIPAWGPPRLSNIGRQADSFYECDAGQGSRSYSLNTGRSPANRFGPQDGGERFIVPATDELRRTAMAAAWRARIFRFG